MSSAKNNVELQTDQHQAANKHHNSYITRSSFVYNINQCHIIGKICYRLVLHLVCPQKDAQYNWVEFQNCYVKSFPIVGSGTVTPFKTKKHAVAEACPRIGIQIKTNRVMSLVAKKKQLGIKID